MNIKKSLDRAKISIIISTVAATLSSASLSLIPLTSGIDDGKNNTLAYIIAAVFWIGLLLVFVSSFVTKKLIDKIIKQSKGVGQVIKNYCVGIISFSKAPEKLVLYGVTALGLVMIVTDIILSYVPEPVMFPIISATILSFAIHCIIDGKYYKAYKLIKENKNETNR